MDDSGDKSGDVSAAHFWRMNNPEDYVMEDEALIAAAKVAELLGKPLLLTGEVGVGKSQFAFWWARHRGRIGPLKFVVKSTTEARDLFYHYDALARFHEAQVQYFENLQMSAHRQAQPINLDVRNPLQYISYNALGKAILFSMGKEEARKQELISDRMIKGMGEFPTEPSSSVVLIDEIDKASRDVPNDMLDEIEHLSFMIRELGGRPVRANRDKYPLVIMTSNSERDLPKPFLRRCVYYHMTLSEDEQFLMKVATRRVGQRFQASTEMIGQAVTLFKKLRNTLGEQEKPGLGELLDFLVALGTDAPPSGNLHEHTRLMVLVRATLLKHQRLTDDELQLALKHR